MKKTLSVLLAALLLCSLCVIFAAAEDVNPDGYAFNIDSVNVAVARRKDDHHYQAGFDSYG